jgi:AraC-like DNA-binding protein
MDPLAETLHSLRLSGGVFLDGHFTAPWCITVRIGPAECAPFIKNATDVIAYHFVKKGQLIVGVEGQPSLEVQAGEVVLFPQNDSHTLASERGLQAVSASTLIRNSETGGLLQIRHGGGGAETEIFCGFLASENRHNPLMSSLPKALKAATPAGTTREWVEASLRFATERSADAKLSSSSVISRLSESLLIDAVRAYSSTLSSDQVGWLNGARDPQVGRALALIHHDLAAPWSVDALAKRVGASRTAFIDRFTALVGTSPIRYLTALRLQTAKLRLRAERNTVSQVAFSIGYSSEEAFSRAFKREFGVPPARWRELR